ncbi:MAG TPA: hypothetical protein VNT03_19645 [Baekduia sp.]|nr:hypothetical protein [Baekduia sp.]
MPSPTVDAILFAIRDAGLGEPGPVRIDAASREPWEPGAPRRRRAPLIRFAMVACAVLAVVATTYAVPPTRAGMGDLYGTFSDWVAGDEHAAPGTAVAPGEQAPRWIGVDPGEQRLLAEVAGQRMYASRHGDVLSIGIPGYGTAATIADWRQQLSGRKLYPVGPGLWLAGSDHHRRALFGLAAPGIVRVDYQYADRSTPVQGRRVRGAWAIVIESDRRPHALVGYDAAGRTVARIDLSHMNYRYCPWRGCQPWRS